MRKEILDALKAKFVGVSDKILGRIAENLAKTATTAEEVTTAVEGVTFQQVLDSYGDSRATEAQQTAVTNYEKKHGLKDGKPAEPKTPEPPAPKAKVEKPKEEDVPAWAQQLIDANKALSDKVAAMEGEKTANGRKARMQDLLKDSPEHVKNRYQKDFDRLTFKDDDDFNTWMEEAKGDIDKLNEDYKSRGGVVTRPKTGGASGNKGEIDPALKARLEERKAETAVPAIAGLPTQTN